MAKGQLRSNKEAKKPKKEKPKVLATAGLNNPVFQIGAAVGVAVVSTVAVARTDDVVGSNRSADPLLALTEGFQSGFLACIVLAGIGLAAALLLLGGASGAEGAPGNDAPDAVPEPVGDPEGEAA